MKDTTVHRSDDLKQSEKQKAKNKKQTNHTHTQGTQITQVTTPSARRVVSSAPILKSHLTTC